jgi:hypothetical protein
MGRPTMNVYLVLLRRMERSEKRREPVSLEPTFIASLAESKNVQLLDLIVCTGIVDAALLCRASDNSTIARLLDSLEGWHTDTLLASSHMRHESTVGGGK